MRLDMGDMQEDGPMESSFAVVPVLRSYWLIAGSHFFDEALKAHDAWMEDVSQSLQEAARKESVFD